MEIVAIVLAVFAVLAMLGARGSIGELKRKVNELESDARRARLDAEDALQKVTHAEAFLKLMAQGGKIDAEMIEEGRLFPEIDSEKARVIVESEKPAGLVVVDVRTQDEVAGGHIEGALWIPVDELEKRAREIPRSGKVLVFCAAGSRSAAACDFLSTHGWNNVTNVVGGMSAYRGKTATGVPGTS